MSENPSAFPCFTVETFGHVGEEPAQLGMTLRDWFAGQALNGWLATNEGQEIGPDSFMNVAKGMYRFADAMLAERERKS